MLLFRLWKHFDFSIVSGHCLQGIVRLPCLPYVRDTASNMDARPSCTPGVHFHSDQAR